MLRSSCEERTCPLCRELYDEAQRCGFLFTARPEPTDLFPNGVGIYIHPAKVAVVSLSDTERHEWQANWFADCPRRCLAFQ